MGQSATAHLVYGVHIGDSYPWIPKDANGDPDWEHPDYEKLNEETELEDYLFDKLGHYDPWLDVPEDVYNGSHGAFEKWKEDSPEWRAKYDEYINLKTEFSNTVPINIERAGYYDEAPVIMHLPKYESNAWAGYLEDVTLVQPSDEEIAAARKFCEDNDLPRFDGAKWMMYSTYG